METNEAQQDAPVTDDGEEWSEADGVGYSLANLRELLIGCLDDRRRAPVIEIGSDRGLLTAELLDWAAGEREIIAVDPAPHPDLEALEREHPELRLIRETSHEVLREVDLTDAIILDGDHNYYTLSGELRIIGERAPDRSSRCFSFTTSAGLMRGATATTCRSESPRSTASRSSRTPRSCPASPAWPRPGCRWTGPPSARAESATGY